MPLALTDNQLYTVMVAARDLPASKRRVLLEAVAVKLRDQPKFSDADLASAVRTALAAIRESVAKVGASSGKSGPLKVHRRRPLSGSNYVP
jgi:hypothetical protein